MKFWINTISRDHVKIGEQEGIVQAGHGRRRPLERLSMGDRMLFYSPKTSLEDGEKLQAFTALATIADEEIYQVEVTKDFQPWRRKAIFEQVEEQSIRPLITQLDFIENPRYWGIPFRRGLFEINRGDFEIIYTQMKTSDNG